MSGAQFWVVVPAAGSGQRFGSELPKQYQSLGDRRVIEHTVGRLLAHPRIAGVQLALAADDAVWSTLPLAASPHIRTTTGGATRMASVQAGLEALQGIVPDGHHVWVHDAARPLLPTAAIDRLCAALDAGRAVGALLALPVRDTVKQTWPDAALPLAAQTLDRERLWLAQTPQAFIRGALQARLREAEADGVTVTDEAQAMERRGYFGQLVEGDARNLKITTPLDLKLAQLYLDDEG